jgi:hypothetical protein
VDRREREHLRAAEEGRKVGVRDGAEELDTTVRGERPKQAWINTFGQIWIVAGGADDVQLRMLGKRFDQAVDAFVRGQPSDEENAATASIGIGPKARGICPSVHDPSSRGRHSKLARRIGRYREEAVEEPWKQASPIPAAKAVIRDRRRDPADARIHSRQPARRAPQLVGMDDVGPTKGMTESARDRVG